MAVGLATYIGIRKLGYDEVAFLHAGTLLRWYEQIKFNRLFFLGFVDIVLIALAYWGAFLLKYGPPWTAELTTWYLNAFPSVLVAQLAVFYALGLYKGVWRAAEVSDLIQVATAVPPAVALAYACAVLSVPPVGVFSFFWIDALALGSLVVGMRSTYQLLDYIRRREQVAAGTALIYGAGRNGQLVLRELLHNPQLGLRPIGFLDDDASLWGRLVNRVPVLGSGDDLKTIIDSQAISTVILSSPTIQEYRTRRILSLCQARGIVVLQGCLQLVPIGTNGMLHQRNAVQHDPESER
jgi:UDP-GlcNAc:undecaprenyl-phosphate GlcNAc-1-phosphate transferase